MDVSCNRAVVGNTGLTKPDKECNTCKTKNPIRLKTLYNKGTKTDSCSECN